MQILGSPPIGDPLEPGSERVVAGRAREKASGQRSIVEARSSDEDRKTASRRDVPDGACRLACVACRGVLLERVGDVNQVMRDAATLGQRHLVGPDVESTIHGGRIAAHDFSTEPGGESDAERALAGGGGAEDCDEPRFVHCVSARTVAMSTSKASSSASPICWVREGQVIGLADTR